VTTYAIMAQAEDAKQSPTGTGPDGTGGGGMGSMFFVMILIFGVFYLHLIRPQQKKEKERQKKRLDMINALKKNDHVMTIGGIHGVVAQVGDDEVTIKVDERNDVRIRVSRDAISRVVGDDEVTGDEKKLSDTPGENR
jgi:preprotein translocase subunit YajC